MFFWAGTRFQKRVLRPGRAFQSASRGRYALSKACVWDGIARMVDRWGKGKGKSTGMQRRGKDKGRGKG